MAEKEYIERGALIAEYDSVHVGPPGGARKLMADAPAADVADVRHGTWTLRSDGSGTCSECGFTQKNVWDYDNQQRFCGVCGAKMDGKRKVETT